MNRSLKYLLLSREYSKLIKRNTNHKHKNEFANFSRNFPDHKQNNLLKMMNFNSIKYVKDK